ncbi:MAG: 5-carboxymethyl-2-hydroxymuconate Delta-isomerase [Pseudomonadota bacterium]
MPHFIIEYSQGQAGVEQVEAMLDAVHLAAADTALFDVDHIRVRALPVAFYRIAGKRDHFIHAQCRIHSGRYEAQRRRLSEAVLGALKAQRWPVKSITVEVVELDRATYAKFIEQ